MSTPHLVIFTLDARAAESLTRDIRLPFVSVVHGNGKQATSIANLDALWLTWMQASYFGITPQFEPHVAVVCRTPETKIKEGFASLIIAGVNLTKDDPPDLIEQLRLTLRAVLEAVIRFNAAGGAIERLGTVTGNLGIGTLPTQAVVTLLQEVWGPT
jgi:hypothetical protein